MRRRFPQIIAWWGTSVEIRSGISRLRRESAIVEEESYLAVRRWTTIIDGLDLIAPTAELLNIAVELPEIYGVRALDAFQLAAGLVWCGERPRNRPFVCADKRLSKAAAAAGFDIVSLV